MIHLHYNITEGGINSKRIYCLGIKGFNPYAWNIENSNSTEKVKTILQTLIQCADSESDYSRTGSSTDYTNKEEKNYRRLLIEKRDLERKRSNIENRLVQIKNDMDIRREKIRTGRTSDSWK